MVGGQAAILWAINYLPDVPSTHLVSKDLDIVVTKDSTAHLRRIPGWLFEPNQTKNWTDSRLGFLKGHSPDGRPLLVEVLHSVNGLDKEDLKHAAYVKVQGVTYRALDPVTMLKAKAANVRDIAQDGPAPRHDRAHLQLLARCVPLYLRDVHAAAVQDPTKEKDSLAVVSRAFKTLQLPKLAATLAGEGIEPRAIIPVEFAESPLPRVRTAYAWQWPLVEKTHARYRSARSGPAPGI